MSSKGGVYEREDVGSVKWSTGASPEDDDGLEEEEGVARRSSGCSVTFANVLGSARLKLCSKNTEGTDSSRGIVLCSIETG